MPLHRTVKKYLIGGAAVLVIGSGLFGLKKFAEPDAPTAVATDPTTSFDAGAGPGQKPKIVPLPWARASSSVLPDPAAQQPRTPSAQSENSAAQAARDAQPTAQPVPEQPAEMQNQEPTQPEKAVAASDSSHDSAIDAMANMSKMNLNGSKK